MPTVLYISYDGMTDSLGQSQVLPYLIGISKEFHFHLISFEKAERMAKNSAVIQKLCDENTIQWHPLSYTKKPPVLSTLYDVFRLFRLAKKLDQHYHFEIIHCRSYLSALVGLSMKRKRGKKFIFDMRGFWADERVDGKIWSLENPVFKTIYQYFKRKEKEFLCESDAIISLTENGKREILSWNLPNISDEKIMVIPCCVNLDLFDSQKVNEIEKIRLRKKFHLAPDDFILGYIGSIGTWYMLPEMLDFFQVLLTQKPTAKFLFLTGEPIESIHSVAQSKGIPIDKVIVDSCLHHDVPNYISLFDYSIFFILPTFSKKASSPTKQGELMAMNVPVFCNSNVGDSDLIVMQTHSGIVVSSLNEQGYLEAIQQMDAFIFPPETLPESTQTIFGLKKGIEKYLFAYHKCID